MQEDDMRQSSKMILISLLLLLVSFCLIPVFLWVSFLSRVQAPLSDSHTNASLLLLPYSVRERREENKKLCSEAKRRRGVDWLVMPESTRIQSLSVRVDAPREAHKKVSHRRDVVFLASSSDDAMETTQGRWRWTDKPLDQAWPEYILGEEKKQCLFFTVCV